MGIYRCEKCGDEMEVTDRKNKNNLPILRCRGCGFERTVLHSENESWQ